jgi:hypothetical protein
MKSVLSPWLMLSLLAIFAAAGCSDDEEEEKEAQPCDLAAQKGCREGRVCEQVAGGEPTCFGAISVRGMVFDTVSGAPIRGAQVVARDVNDAAVSGIAISDEQGKYVLAVPVQRNPDGTAVSSPTYFLRADATNYQTFPTPPRVALPITITPTGDPPVVESETTKIGLVPLDDTTGLCTVSGRVVAENPGGTLVVAGGSTAIADRKGGFTVFNVQAGPVEVRGYLQNVNLESQSLELAAGEKKTGVELKALDAPTAVVSGKIEIVNPGQGTDTSVILVVKDTFLASAARGEAPPGLKADNVSGTFSIPGVPNGSYVVLAAFENDFLVRDESGIGGTQIVTIEVSGADYAIPDSFKVTGALAVIYPDSEDEDVSGTPSFQWEDDSSEKRYSVVVFDALGNTVWEKADVPAVSGGGGTVTQLYEGPALEPGMIYQFKAKSWSALTGGSVLSSTEDLKGVFTYK